MPSLSQTERGLNINETWFAVVQVHVTTCRLYFTVTLQLSVVQPVLYQQVIACEMLFPTVYATVHSMTCNGIRVRYTPKAMLFCTGLYGRHPKILNKVIYVYLIIWVSTVTLPIILSIKWLSTVDDIHTVYRTVCSCEVLHMLTLLCYFSILLLYNMQQLVHEGKRQMDQKRTTFGNVFCIVLLLLFLVFFYSPGLCDPFTYLHFAPPPTSDP